MDIISDLLIGIGLAMDAAAVSVAGGANARKKGKRIMDAALLAALYFGTFQALMLAIGWLGGEGVRTAIAGIDHWVAFGLLGFVGSRMLLDSFRKHEEGRADLFEQKLLLMLAIATSIDALIVGAGLAFADGSLAATSIIVGIVTAVISFSAVFIGCKHGSVLGNRAETVGGLILIAIGARILLAHLSGA